MIASDIDGTLTHSRNVIPLTTCRVLNHLIDLQIPVVLITGFNYHAARSYVRPLNDRITLIVQNGTLCERENRLVWELRISENKARDIYHFLDRLEVPIIVYKGKVEDFRVLCQGRGYLADRSTFTQVESVQDFHNVTGISTYIPNTHVDEIRSRIGKLTGNDFQLIQSMGKERSWLEVTPPQARKDKALRRFCREMSIPLAEVIYFGDNYNDMDALDAVGLPVVVDNAVPELKSRFKTVIASVYNEGVALYLAQLYGLSVREEE